MKLKIFKYLVVLPLLLCLYTFMAGGEIIVTNVQVIKSQNYSEAEITLNKSLMIKDISVMQAGGRIYLKFPEYISKKKRSYPQVMLLTKQANEEVKNAVINRKPSIFKEAQPGNVSYKIVKFSKFKKESNLKAFVSISFNDAVQVECKIIDGRNGAWVAWPAVKSKKTGKWNKQFIIIDKKLKETIEQDLLEKYATVLAEEGSSDDE